MRKNSQLTRASVATFPFFLVFCATTTHARAPDGNKLNTSPFHHILHDTDSDNIENSSEGDVDGDDGAWHSDDDDQMNEADSDGIEDADGSYDGVDWINDDSSAADTDGDGLNESDDSCPWADEADGKKCVVVIKFEDLFPF